LTGKNRARNRRCRTSPHEIHIFLDGKICIQPESRAIPDTIGLGFTHGIMPRHTLPSLGLRAVSMRSVVVFLAPSGPTGQDLPSYGQVEVIHGREFSKRRVSPRASIIGSILSPRDLGICGHVTSARAPLSGV
jgi:hypothetical protein